MKYKVNCDLPPDSLAESRLAASDFTINDAKTVVGQGIMHDTVLDFVSRTLTWEHVEGKRVLEVGSYDVNGSVRPLVEKLRPFEYVGVDAQAGPGVDRVIDCEQLTTHVGRSAWNLVISTEMLEHVDDWRLCMAELVEAVAPGGYLLVTTRSPGFPYHEFPVDNWRFTREQMFEILAVLQMVTVRMEDDPEPGVLVLARKPIDAQTISPAALRAVMVWAMRPNGPIDLR